MRKRLEFLREQNDRLRDLNRMKNDFVATVSHELRTPLTAIKGSIDLILGGVTGPISGETAEMLQITQKNADRLIRMINEILDISRIEAGAIQLNFDRHSFAETIDHAIKGVLPYAQTRGLNVLWSKPELSPSVCIDRDRIEQVITNLLSNAIKFTPPGGTVCVRIFHDERRGYVEVSDTGRGIPPEFLGRVFHKFQSTEGTGLGLAIAKAIVESHGGAIGVESRVGHGSRFTFWVPLGSPQAEN